MSSSQQSRILPHNQYPIYGFGVGLVLMLDNDQPKELYCLSDMLAVRCLSIVGLAKPSLSCNLFLMLEFP